ncbi:hypothetical protein M885DRAFT_584787 [Pelagophyceae sp. CCMP2097]|nr:hypothetical protein M885DRAFT_584787 [Pelagophyceae sp. CCMP2097]
MASLEELSHRERKRVARLVQQLLHVGAKHDAAAAEWEAEAADLRAAAEAARSAAEATRAAAAEAKAAADRRQAEAAAAAERRQAHLEAAAERRQAHLEAVIAQQTADLAAADERCDKRLAHNRELVSETVELRSKLVKALRLVRTYQDVVEAAEAAHRAAPARGGQDAATNTQTDLHADLRLQHDHRLTLEAAPHAAGDERRITVGGVGGRIADERRPDVASFRLTQLADDAVRRSDGARRSEDALRRSDDALRHSDDFQLTRVADEKDGGDALPSRTRGDGADARARRLALAAHALAVAYGSEEVSRVGDDLEGHRVLTPADVELAFRSSADVSYGEICAPDGVEMLLDALDVGGCINRRRGDGQLLELGAGTGKLALSAFIIEPRLRVVRGVELCASRFAVAERAWLRLVEASRFAAAQAPLVPPRGWRGSLPRLELVARTDSLLRIATTEGRVLELRRGDLAETPRAVVGDADVVLLLCRVPKTKAQGLGRLLDGLTAHARVASLESLDHASLAAVDGPRPRVKTSWAAEGKTHPIYVYERVLRQRPQNLDEMLGSEATVRIQPRSKVDMLGWRDDNVFPSSTGKKARGAAPRRAPQRSHSAGARVCVASRRPHDTSAPRHGRVLVVHADGALTVLYDADGTVEERIQARRVQAPRQYDNAHSPPREWRSGSSANGSSRTPSADRHAGDSKRSWDPSSW